MYKKWNLFIILTLLFGLVFTGPKQTVVAATPDLTIEPYDLPDWEMTVNFQLQLVAMYAGGGECTGCLWYTTQGDLPEGVFLNTETGELLGAPTTVGTYNFTIVVEDGNGLEGRQDYFWNITQVKTIVKVGDSSTYVGNTTPTSLSASAQRPNSYYSPQPTGIISFSVNGVPVPGCSGKDAKTTNNEGAANCTSYLPTGLTAGAYDIQADFTPNAASSSTYMSGTGIGTLQVNPRQAIVSGRVFLDDNKNSIYDEEEAAQGAWHVDLNQDCDTFLEGDVVTNEITGTFTFYPVPIEGHTYCLSVNLSGFPDGYVQTTPYNDLTLSEYQYFEIGVYYPHITILPNSEELQSGSVGTYYEQTFQISGGTEPYTIEPTAALPAGLIFDKNTLTLSGTPTAGGLGQLNLYVTDSNGLSASREYTFRIMADGDFTFTSSSNPSAPGEPVTFTVSASGEAVTPIGILPPAGVVTFFADENEIEGCSFLYLNATMDESGEPVFGNYPATCTTDALAEGSHEITAIYFDGFEIYNQPTLSLTQLVKVVEPLTILPETLPDATYGTPFSQSLTGVCFEGYSCGYPQWRLKSGSLPSGIILEQYGLIQGSPSVTGTFTFTIEGYDVNYSDQSLGTRTYTWNILKVNPKVTFGEMITYYGKTYLNVYVRHPNSSWSANPAGSVTVSVDESPVDVCTNLSPIPDMPYLYSCITTDELVGLMPGSHTLHADFTPDANAAPNYNSANGETTFTNPPRIEGFQFNDLDRDGVRDDGEESGYFGYVQLDRDCDGSPNGGTPVDNSGKFFLNITPGEYCLSVLAYGKWYQSTILEPFTVTADTYKYFEIGFYESQLTYDPEELPSATAGKIYAQTITISGGVPPYSLISANQDFPGEFKFDITFNETSFTISGAPTTYGEGYVSLDLQDSTGMKGNWNSSIVIKEDGFFNLTSSSNPANQGEEVTFTVSATGDVVYYDGPHPPMGTVTFYADGTPIDGCSEIFLNFDQDWIIGEFPAICKTSGLEPGSHAITAAYLDSTGFYNDTTLDLTQVVNTTNFADLSINKTDSKDPVKPGSKLVYALTVKNLGADLAESVIVTDKLDVNTTFLSVSAPRGWSCSYVGNSGTVTCTTGSLKSGSSAIIKITVMVNKTAKVGKELVNNAFVSSTTFDPDLSNNAVVQKTLVTK